MTMTSAMNSMKSSDTRLIPLGQVANIEITDGPPMIKGESGIIMHVYLDLAYKKHRREKGLADADPLGQRLQEPAR